MNVQVRYLSKAGNTKKVAEAIAAEAGVQAENIETPVSEKADILFLGGAVYWGGIDGKLKQFMAALDPSMVGKVAVFSTSSMTERAYPSMANALKAKGIDVLEDNFYCRGTFAMVNKGHPDDKDLAAAKEFAKEVLAAE